MKRLWILPLLALASCHLVDQRDFHRNAGAKPKRAVAAVHPQPVVPPLISIRFATPAPDYAPAVAAAARRALARKPDVLFTVTTLVPAARDIATEADAAMLAASSGREVAQAIVAAGAASGQVVEQVQVRPGLAVTEVDVTVQ